MSTAAEGYKQAIDVLLGVAQRTGSPAAQWAADYLTADPDKQAPAVGADLSRFQLDVNFWDDHAQVWCLTCRTRWGIGDCDSLAELNQRADEHTEVCR